MTIAHSIINSLRLVAGIFVTDTNAQNIAVRRAQVAAFTKQVPLLYFGLTVNCITLAFTYYGSAPAFLTVIVPAFVITFCSVRTIIWLRTRDIVMSDAAVAERVKTLVR